MILEMISSLSPNKLSFICLPGTRTQLTMAKTVLTYSWFRELFSFTGSKYKKLSYSAFSMDQFWILVVGLGEDQPMAQVLARISNQKGWDICYNYSLIMIELPN